MLVLGRFEGESVRVGDNVNLTVGKIFKDKRSGHLQVRLVFDAPMDVRIMRSEIISKEKKDVKKDQVG